MSSDEPQVNAVGVPPLWVHPDLLRLMQEERLPVNEDYEEKAKEGLRRLRWRKLVAQRHQKEVSGKLEALEKKMAELNSDLERHSKAFKVFTVLEDWLDRQLKQGLGLHQAIARRASHSNRLDLFTPASAAELVLQKKLVPEPCSLEVNFFHHFTAVSMWESSGENVVESEANAFLREWFPVLQWDSSNGGSAKQLMCSELPCLIEKDIFHSGSPLQCVDAGCIYRHGDELTHLREIYTRKLVSMRSTFCTTNADLCIVSKYLRDNILHLQRCSSTRECVGLLQSIATHLVRLGWAQVMCPASASTEVEETQPSLRNVAQCRPWLVPVLSHFYPYLLFFSPNAPTSACLEDLLREDDELRAWRPIRVKLGKGKTSRREMALQQFRSCPTALNYRVVIRAAAQSEADHRHLAYCGWRMFPSSPHLAVQYVLSLTSSEEWEAAPVVQTCLDVLRELSTQSIGSLFSKNSVAAAQYTALAARYGAYLVAVTAVRLCSRSKRCEGEKAALFKRKAQELLEEAMLPGRYFFLPIALYNFHLMVAALATGNLESVEHLPLGALSDLPLLLSSPQYTPLSTSAADAWVPSLKGLFELLKGDLHPRLLDELKSSQQVSLLRSRGAKLDMLGALLSKVTVGGEQHVAAVWLEYLGMLDREEGESEYAKKVKRLLLETAWRGKQQLAFLLLQWSLAPLARSSIEPLETPSEAECIATIGREPAEVLTSFIEEAAGNVLESNRMVRLRDRVTFLCQRVMEKRLCHDSKAVVLVLFALLRICAKTVHLECFERSISAVLTVLHEQHLTWWSALDPFFDDIVGPSHYVTLLVYQLVPALLGPHASKTYLWRMRLLSIGAKIGTLHPLLFEKPNGESGEGC